MIWREGGDNSPGNGDKALKGVLERLIGFNDCLHVLAWGGLEERRNSKLSMTQIEHAGGAGLAGEALINTFSV